MVIVPVGSRGDVQPFTVVGLGLKKKGHKVRIATHAVFESVALPTFVLHLQSLVSV